MDQFGDEIAKRVGRAILVAALIVTILLVGVFFLGRYSA